MAIALVGAITGITRWQFLALAWKIVITEMIAVVCVQTTAIVLMELKHHNVWLLNIFILMDMVLLGISGILLLGKGNIQRLMAYSLAAVFILCLASWAAIGIRTEINTVAFLTSGIYLCLLYMILLFRSSISEHPFRQPALWLCLALIIYFGCNIPFFSLFHFLSTNSERWKKIGFYLYFINTALSLIRYSLVSYSLWLVVRQRRDLQKLPQ